MPIRYGQNRTIGGTEKIKMETPTTQDIIDKLILLKTFIKSQDLQMGLSHTKEKIIINHLNAIIRMEKFPVRRIEFIKRLKRTEEARKR